MGFSPTSMEFNQFLGMEVAAEHDDGLTLEMPIGAQHLNYDGVVHGGATAALADASVGVAILRKWPGCRMATIEMKINYLRPAKEGKLRARSKFVKAGRTVVVATSDVTDDKGELIATALMSYILMRLDHKKEG